MNESFGGFTQQTGDGAASKRMEGTLPVLIKQLNQQKQEVFKFWGFEYKMVTIVAVVRNIEHSSTKITYLLEDRTGKIIAHLWVAQEDAPESSNIMLDTYVRVTGGIRHQGETRSIMIYNIQPVKSVNEVNTHMVEVVNARYQAEEYFRGGIGPTTGTVVKTEPSSQSIYGTPASSFAPSQSAGPGEGKAIAVFKVIQASLVTNPDRGTSKQELYAKFPHISANEIENILEKLSGDGQIYSTADADHFLACF